MPASISTVSDRWGGLTARCVRACHARPALTVAVYALLLALAGALIATQLRIEADPAALLPEDLSWRRTALALERAFPDRHHSIVAVIDGDTDAARKAVEALRGELQRRQAPIRLSSAPGLDPYFERQGLLYLELPALERTARDLEAAQPLLGRLAGDPSLAGLAATLRLLLERSDAAPRVQASVEHVAAAIESVNAGAPRALDWAALALPAQPQPTRHFLSLVPADRASERAALSAVRAAIATLPADAPRVRLTGEVPGWADEIDAASAGALWSAAASLLLVALMLFAGLRSLRLVLAALLSLICGLVLTAGFAALAVGRLNLISLAFAALYIGLAIDFAAHLLLRYRELRLAGAGSAAAIADAGRDVGSALLLCALTTAAAFYAFVPTSFRGVAELGLISGSGILIGLLTTLSLLPALLALLGHRPLRASASGAQLATRLADWPFAHRRLVLAGAAVAALLALLQLPQLRFDYNPMHLKPAHTESQRVYEELVEGNASPLTASLLVQDAAQARSEAARLAQLDVVRETRWLGSFVPQDQDAKLALIDALALSVGAGLPERLALAAVDPQRDRGALRDLHALARARAGADASAARLARALDAWHARHDAAADAQALTLLRDTLLGRLPQLLQRLQQALQAAPVSVDDLPEALLRDWRSADGRYRVEIVPAENLNDDAALRRFADAIHAAAPEAAGPPLEYVGGARTVMDSFTQAFTVAAAVIVLLLLALLRNLADCLRALVPLALGALLTAGACAATGLKLNFANIIALPLLLGVAVDSGVHLIWRARHHAGNPLLGSTGRAVLIAVLTTLSSFASLMLSAHRGMASMGAMLTLGLLLMLLCSFGVLPALLRRRELSVGADERRQWPP